MAWRNETTPLDSEVAKRVMPMTSICKCEECGHFNAEGKRSVHQRVEQAPSYSTNPRYTSEVKQRLVEAGVHLRLELCIDEDGYNVSAAITNAGDFNVPGAEDALDRVFTHPSEGEAVCRLALALVDAGILPHGNPTEAT